MKVNEIVCQVVVFDFVRPREISFREKSNNYRKSNVRCYQPRPLRDWHRRSALSRALNRRGKFYNRCQWGLPFGR